MRIRSKLVSDISYKTGVGTTGATSNIDSSSWSWSTKEPPSVTQRVSMSTVHDEITPNFTDIVKAGGVKPVHPFSLTKAGSVGFTISYGVEGSPAPGGHTPGEKYSRGMSFAVGHNPSPFSNLARNELRIEALARFNAESIDLLTSTLEFHKTVYMVKNFRQNVMKGVLKAIREWKKSKPSKKQGLKDAWDSFSDFWLEYRYGWRILYYEVTAILEYIENMDKGVLVVPARASREETTHMTGRTSLGAGPDSRIHVYWDRQTLHRLRSGVVGTIDSSVISSLNLPRTAWELVPFSFVIDWFVGVGTLIDAFIPAKGRSVAQSWDSETFESLVTYRWEKNPSSKYNVRFCDLVQYGDSTAKMGVRTVGTTPVPIPPLTFNLNPGQILDLATLLKAINRELSPSIRR